jgi:hypothetical protein
MKVLFLLALLAGSVAPPVAAAVLAVFVGWEVALLALVALYAGAAALLNRLAAGAPFGYEDPERGFVQTSPAPAPKRVPTLYAQEWRDELPLADRRTRVGTRR